MMIWGLFFLVLVNGYNKGVESAPSECQPLSENLDPMDLMFLKQDMMSTFRDVSVTDLNNWEAPLTSGASGSYLSELVTASNPSQDKIDRFIKALTQHNSMNFLFEQLKSRYFASAMSQVAFEDFLKTLWFSKHDIAKYLSSKQEKFARRLTPSSLTLFDFVFKGIPPTKYADCSMFTAPLHYVGMPKLLEVASVNVHMIKNNHAGTVKYTVKWDSCSVDGYVVLHMDPLDLMAMLTITYLENSEKTLIQVKGDIIGVVMKRVCHQRKSYPARTFLIPVKAALDQYV